MSSLRQPGVGGSSPSTLTGSPPSTLIRRWLYWSPPLPPRTDVMVARTLIHVPFRVQNALHGTGMFSGRRHVMSVFPFWLHRHGQVYFLHLGLHRYITCRHVECTTAVYGTDIFFGRVSHLLLFPCDLSSCPILFFMAEVLIFLLL